MFSLLRNRFGIPGVISVIALVFAMIGGAYAANDSSSGDSKASASAVKKGPRGPRGPKGPAGPAGPQGPAGPAGLAGPAGKDGAAGPEGKEGKAGKDGSPWTAGGTLPSKATMTGAWVYGPISPAPEPGFAPVDATQVSFPIPLAAELSSANVHYINVAGKEVTFIEDLPPVIEESTSTACLGSAKAPTASPGHLCVYAAYEKNLAPPPETGLPPGPAASLRKAGGLYNQTSAGASTAGARLGFSALYVEDGAAAGGTWAVMAP